MKSQHMKNRKRAQLIQGLTLVEMMVAVGLGSLVLATVASLSLYGARSSMAVANYADLDMKNRYALDVISLEVRQATALTGFQTNSFLSFTNASQAAVITLTYDPNARTLVLTKTGQPPLTALTQCDDWAFSLYQRTPFGCPTNLIFFPATNNAGALDLSACKVINMTWKCSRPILGLMVNTESAQSAQIVLRNKS